MLTLRVLMSVAEKLCLKVRARLCLLIHEIWPYSAVNYSAQHCHPNIPKYDNGIFYIQHQINKSTSDNPRSVFCVTCINRVTIFVVCLCCLSVCLFVCPSHLTVLICQRRWYGLWNTAVSVWSLLQSDRTSYQVRY